MTEPGLQRPGVVPCIGQRIATGVPGHVREDLEGPRVMNRRSHRGLMSNVVNFEAARRPTPEATIEAIKQTVRTGGLAALKEAATRDRLSRCDEPAIKALDD